MNTSETTFHSLLLLVLVLALPAFAVNRIADARTAAEGTEVAMQAGLPVDSVPAFDIEAVAPDAQVAFEVAADFELVVTTPPADVLS